MLRRKSLGKQSSRLGESQEEKALLPDSRNGHVIPKVKKPLAYWLYSENLAEIVGFFFPNTVSHYLLLVILALSSRPGWPQSHPCFCLSPKCWD